MIHYIHLLVKTARSEEKDEMHQLVRDLIKKGPISMKTGDTLLHFCVATPYTFNPRHLYSADGVSLDFHLLWELFYVI